MSEAARREFQYSSAWLHPPHRRVLEFLQGIATLPGAAISYTPSSHQHFDKFCDVYHERSATTYGMFRLDRIRDLEERFLTCGDYRRGRPGMIGVSLPMSRD